MANALGYYNPVFYANEGLIHLKKALGFASTVYMGYDESRKAHSLGDTINIKRPSTFVAQAAPSTAQDITSEQLQLTLGNWFEVKFKLTDKELAYTGEQIINEHVGPAAYALADKIDQDGYQLLKDIPWVVTAAAATYAPVDIISARKQLFDNACPMKDMTALSLMIGSGAEKDFLGNSAFGQWQGAGQQGVNTQITGSLGARFGFGNIFANQNVSTFTPGTFSGTVTVNGAQGVNLSTVALSVATPSGTITKGCVIKFASHSQLYVVTADTAMAASISVPIFPPLRAAITNSSSVTISGFGTDSAGSAKDTHLGYHKNAFALAFAKLPDYGSFAGSLGMQVASIQDPVTGLAIRSRIYAVGNSSEVHVALDVLYGWKTIDPNLAVRLRQN